MSQPFFCPVGHQWQADAAHTLASAVCPVCGLAAVGPATTADAIEATLPPPEGSPDAPTLAPLPSAMSDPAKPPQIPGYDMLEEIGRGGMGVVYKARQVRLHRLVAIKMILAGGHAGPKELARFQAEAEAVARIQHPHIVQIYDVAESEGRPYLTLEYLEGGTLAQKLHGQPQEPLATARLLEKLARAVHAAHQRGIIHRDLKPANVLLAADGTPKIADFSLAKCLDSDIGQTQSGAIVGTPSYMAPEQAGGKRKLIGPATDVYALGAILYECLTGRPPFVAETPFDTILKVAAEEVVPPCRLQPKVPRNLETICLKCLEKEPAKRYASAEELAEDLHRFQAGEPIRARRLNLWERAVRRSKRLRAVALVLSGAALALALLLVLRPLWSGDTSAKTENETQHEEAALLPPDLDLVPGDAFGFVSLRVADLFAQDGNQVIRKMLFKKQEGDEFLPYIGALLQQLDLKLTDVERVTLVQHDFRDLYASTVLIVTTSRPYGRARAPTARMASFPGGGREYPMAEGPAGAGLLLLDEKIFLLTPPASPDEAGWDRWKVLEAFLARIPPNGAQGVLRPALQLAASTRYKAVLGLRPTALLMAMVREELPLEEPLLRDLSALDLHSVTVTLESRPTSGDAPSANITQLTANLIFPNESQARVAELRLPEVTSFAKMAATVDASTMHAAGAVSRRLLDELEFAWATAHVERQGNEVHVRLAFKSDLSTNLGEQWEALRGDALRTQSQNILRQFALGMSNYVEANKNELPPAAILSKDGKPLLSWRVAILPYIEQENLYRAFKLDEPWDSEHNKKLLEQMPRIFRPLREIRGQQPFTTFFQVFVGPKGEAPFEIGRRMRYPAEFADGTANTFLIVEAMEPVPWTKPADIPYSSKGPLPKLGGIVADGFNAAMADGSVRFIKRTMSEQTLRAAITPAGNDKLGPDWAK